MNSDYRNFGMDTASLRFAREVDPRARTSEFEARMRTLESGAASLNLAPEMVHLSAEIAAMDPRLNDSDRIALIIVAIVSLAALQEGSTRFPVTGPEAREPMRRMLAPLCADAVDVENAIRNVEDLLRSGRAASVIGSSPHEFKPLLYLAPFIYHHRIHSAEASLAVRLADLLKRGDASAVDARVSTMLADVAKRPTMLRGQPLNLSNEQLDAVRIAVAGRLALISGGPGTGKTSIVLAILRLLVRLGIEPSRIALSAPTGKAAYRIGEAVRDGLAQLANPAPSDDALAKSPPHPTTLHRLLGYSPTMRRFRHHRNNPLAESVVIVDEGSMLDLNLMARLLDAISPDARLVILGDTDQLPSVSAGAVFRDLLPGTEPAALRKLARGSVRLTHSYRMNAGKAGSAIYDLAGAINAGDEAIFDDSGSAGAIIRRTSAAQLAFSSTEWLDEPSGRLGSFLDRWYAELVRGNESIREIADREYVEAAAGGFGAEECEKLRHLFEHRARARILCVTRVLDSGSQRINERLHRRASGMRSDGSPLIAGEPVIVLRNDYDRGLFNGDQGLILRVRRAGAESAMAAVFPRDDNFISFRIDSLRDELELCYAMTVHKAQGSEFDSVAAIMPADDLPMLSREILYTAVSRARKSVTMVGKREIIRAAISRRMDRYCGLREHLSSMLA